ncbi:hypothetical protein AVEN_128099-1 [Araneus ventricosus]|uniref:Uncharacterized protein n=1 Tax=Araneus ventricosus TaxID=182803 RepID=A0A4Y1ZZH4_ARAVE|nr:hypothetical protein AVEN_128099-1 [Araneus ventricosus]
MSRTLPTPVFSPPNFRITPEEEQLTLDVRFTTCNVHIRGESLVKPNLESRLIQKPRSYHQAFAAQGLLCGELIRKSNDKAHTELSCHDSWCTRVFEWQEPQQHSGAEAGVLHGISPPKEVRPVIGVEVTGPPTIIIPTREARPRLLIRRLLIRELVVLSVE